MKTIKKGIPQTIALDQSGLTSGKDVYLSIIGEDGTNVKDSNSVDIKEKKLSYNSDESRYELEATILESSPVQYIRLFFYSSEVEIEPDYYPEDVKLDSTPDKLVGTVEIVPVTYFTDYVVAASAKMDSEYEDAVTNYLRNNGNETFRVALRAAQNELELDLEMYITERELTEKRDNNFERFAANLWQLAVYYPPINELVNFEIKYGVNEIANVGLDLFTFERVQGLIDFLPLPGGDSTGLYTLLIRNISGMGLALINGGLLDRIPNMFWVTYKTGLWYSGTDDIEKEGLRLAVSRRALINLIPIMDPTGRKASVSESIDGVAGSESYQTAKLREELKKDEEKWVIKVQRRYGKSTPMVIV